MINPLIVLRESCRTTMHDDSNIRL